MRKAKIRPKLRRGKPKGIARKVAARKRDLDEKAYVSMDGVAADFPEYEDFFEIYCEQFGHAPAQSAEARLLAALKVAIKNCDDTFFERLARLAKRQKQSLTDGPVDELGVRILWTMKSLKAQGRRSSVKNVLNAIGTKSRDNQVEYDEREIRRAMKALRVRIEKGQ